MIKPDVLHEQLATALPAMKLVSDSYSGEPYVSAYLPNPSPSYEDPLISHARFDAYKERANYYNVTRRTIQSLVGMVFSKYPMIDNADNFDKKEIAQTAKRAVIEVLQKGRCGLLADYPINQGVVSKQQLNALGYQPKVKLYPAESVINWRTENDKLTLVVIREKYVTEDDGFSLKTAEQLIVLRLTDGVATSQLVQQKDGQWVFGEVSAIRQSNGKAFSEIPFTFIGSENNDADVDDSPMYDLAKVNIAHYRNSADYEESIFLAGQPTLFVSGVTDAWRDEYYDGVTIDANGKEVFTEGHPITLGSRTAHLLGVGSTAQLLQADANTALFEAMSHKEQQMVALGAKLIDTSTTNKTATEANSENATNTSVLSTIANNVSDAFSKALNYCCLFTGDKPECVVTLNTNYQTNKMTAQERQQLIAEWQSGAISFKEMRDKLVEDEIATVEDVEQAQAEIEAYSNDSVMSALTDKQNTV
ncbi:DUF4055 domain-containing protein [Moraxella osloensis]|uniref:DUF4055 domain-containing protein n=1 Tax=Faucicola osloensis TaxID=34062 RepID=UPI002005D722|nr:DUF4055 domain-containing protein [Moraxella osloensis]MCK6158022.1 DUF4055 domain-containing protein [Moraxella osloensis]